ncbi:hypothetical protein R5R35_000331 [Gryllus longicercus]|uniref:Uncharacterized protein n=1 Tax=Gryllus longicercus TaxID=2509291 RepID=A0AAN9W4G4_9ORTH
MDLPLPCPILTPYTNMRCTSIHAGRLVGSLVCPGSGGKTPLADGTGSCHPAGKDHRHLQRKNVHYSFGTNDLNDLASPHSVLHRTPSRSVAFFRGSCTTLAPFRTVPLCCVPSSLRPRLACPPPTPPPLPPATPMARLLGFQPSQSRSRHSYHHLCVVRSNHWLSSFGFALELLIFTFVILFAPRFSRRFFFFFFFFLNNLSSIPPPLLAPRFRLCHYNFSPPHLPFARQSPSLPPREVTKRFVREPPPPPPATKVRAQPATVTMSGSDARKASPNCAFYRRLARIDSGTEELL